MESDDWIKYKTDDGVTRVKWDAEVNTQEEAEKKYGKDSKDIGKSGVWHSNQNGSQYWQLNSDGSYEEVKFSPAALMPVIPSEAVDMAKFGLNIGHASPDDDKWGLQAVGYDGESGSPEEAVAGKFDPHKNTLYMTAEDMFVLGLPAGFLSTIERPEMPDTELPSYLKEKTETEPGEGNPASRNYGIGAEYYIDDYGTSVYKNADGTIDTIKRDYKNHTVDTVKEKKKPLH